MTPEAAAVLIKAVYFCSTSQAFVSEVARLHNPPWEMIPPTKTFIPGVGTLTSTWCTEPPQSCDSDECKPTS